MKRKICFVMALLVSFSVSCASFVYASEMRFYDGAFAFSIARRSPIDPEDYTYVQQIYNDSLFSSASIVDAEKYGIAAMYPNRTYNNVPSYFSATVPQCVIDRGVVYFTFCFAYRVQSGMTVNFSAPKNLDAWIYNTGSFNSSKEKGVHGYSKPLKSGTGFTSNTVIVNAPSNGYNPAYPWRTSLTLPNGSSIPTSAFYNSSDSLLFSDSVFLNYTDTADSWRRSQTFFYKIDFSDFNLSGKSDSDITNTYNTVYVDLSSLFTSSSFRPVVTEIEFWLDNSFNPNTQSALGYSCPCFYLCPSSAFAVSRNSSHDIDDLYEELTSYHSDFDALITALQNLTVPQNLESQVAQQVESKVDGAQSKLESLSEGLAFSEVDVSNLGDFGILEDFDSSSFQALSGFTQNTLSFSKFLKMATLSVLIAFISLLFFGGHKS